MNRVAIVFSSANAKSIFPVYEYAELRDMGQDQLVNLYCRYDRSRSLLLDVALAEIKAGRAAASRRAQINANLCAQECGRIERLLESKFQSKPPSKCRPTGT
jgi:hypothetical protein